MQGCAAGIRLVWVWVVMQQSWTKIPVSWQAPHLLVCVMGTQEVWVLVCALLVILQKTPLEVQWVRGGNLGKKTAWQVSYKHEGLLVVKDRWAAVLKAGHRCLSELCSLVWFESSPSLTGRVLFGRREAELREVFEWEVRLIPAKLQVALCCLVAWLCLCLQGRFLLSLNSVCIRHCFLV